MRIPLRSTSVISARRRRSRFELPPREPDATTSTTMSRMKTRVLPPCSHFTQTSLPVRCLLLVLALQTFSVGQPGRARRAQVYVSRHRKSSKFPSHSSIPSLELHDRPRRIIPSFLKVIKALLLLPRMFLMFVAPCDPSNIRFFISTGPTVYHVILTTIHFANTIFAPTVQ